MVQPTRRTATDETRSYRIILRVNATELSSIDGNADLAGMTRSEYLRHRAIHGEIVVYRQSAYGESLTRQLKHIGININQLMRYIHNHEEIPPEFFRACAKLEALLDKLLRAE